MIESLKKEKKKKNTEERQRGKKDEKQKQMDNEIKSEIGGRGNNVRKARK